MNNFKEYYEILSLFKEYINQKEFTVTDESFTKDFLKSLIVNSGIFSPPLNVLKDKYKFQFEKNKNKFQLIKNLSKKQQKENRIILYNNTKFDLFFNEPEYIKILNFRIYEKFIIFLNDLAREFKLISIVNGTEDVLQDENYDKFIEKKKLTSLMNLPSILNEIYSVKNENLKLNSGPFHFRLKKFDSMWLKQTYGEIITKMLNYEEDSLSFKKFRDKLDAYIKDNKKAKLLELLKNGVPNSLRKKVYLYLMGIDSNSIDSIKLIDDSVYLIDYLLLEDVKSSTANENYFLFQENLKTVLFQFIRDKDILSEIQGIRPVLYLACNKVACPYPFSGFIPIKGLAFLCAPFCYSSNNIPEIILLFKNFYCKYLSYLSSFTTNKNSVLSLLYNFNCMFSTLPEMNSLYLHLQRMSYDINIIVFEWLSTCFGEILSPENMFILYDLIIISDNLSILVIAVLSLIYNKMNLLLTVQTKEEVKHIFSLLKYENIQILYLISNYIDVSQL